MRGRRLAVPLLMAALAIAAVPLFDAPASGQAAAESAPRVTAPSYTATIALSDVVRTELDVLARLAPPNWQTCITGARVADTVQVLAQIDAISVRSCPATSFGHAVRVASSTGPCVPTVSDARAFDLSADQLRILVCGPGNYAVMARIDWLFGTRPPAVAAGPKS